MGSSSQVLNRFRMYFCNLPKVVPYLVHCGPGRHLKAVMYVDTCSALAKGALMHTTSARIGICYYPIPQMLSRHLCLTNGLAGETN